MAAYVVNKSDPDYIRGADILKRFYDLNRSLYPSNVNYTFEQMVTTLQGRTGQKAFIEGLGFGINASGYTNSIIQNAMKKLAEQARGKIPSKNSDFRNILIDEGTKINFVDAITYTAAETAKTVADGAVSIGESIINTGKLVNLFLPVIAGVIIYFWIMKQK